MTIILTFVVNAGLNFALGLIVAKFLGPEAFGRYALALAAAVALNTLLFEWLRLSATRFYSEHARQADPGIRATLDLGYTAIVLALAGLVAAAAAAGADLGLPAVLLAAAAAAGLGMGLFDYQAALARARFLDHAYARLVLLKNGAAFVLMVGGAYWFRDPALVLAGSALSAFAAILMARHALSDPEAGLRLARKDTASAFAAYAIPLVAANVLYQVVPLMNRGWLAARDGYAEAGQFALAADVGLRLFMIVGSALDILLFQMAVRVDHERGRAEAEAQIVRNAALVAALLLPFAAGFWLALPALEALVVPAAFQGAFADYAAILIPTFLAFGLIQYALNPLFQLHRRTGTVVLAALAALAVDAGLLFALPPLIGPAGVAVAQLCAMATALIIVGSLALRMKAALLPWRDLGLAVLATGVMTAALAPLRGLPPVLALAALAVLGALIYTSFVAMFDIASLRTLVQARFGRARPLGVPAQ
jgi:O-antigen/teichoic acid export membrane protein